MSSYDEYKAYLYVSVKYKIGVIVVPCEKITNLRIRTTNPLSLTLTTMSQSQISWGLLKYKIS